MAKKVIAKTTTPVEVVNTTPVMETKTTNKKVTNKKANTTTTSTPVVATTTTPVVTAPVVTTQPTKTKSTKSATTKTAPETTPVNVVPQTVQTGGETTVVENNKRIRYFKVSDATLEGGKFFGRFSGIKPKQAANKAFSSLLKLRNSSSMTTDGKIAYTLQECTRRSKHKMYYYIGERKQLTEPTMVKINNGSEQKTIEYKFSNKILKDKTPKSTTTVVPVVNASA